MNIGYTKHNGLIVSACDDFTDVPVCDVMDSIIYDTKFAMLITNNAIGRAFTTYDPFKLVYITNNFLFQRMGCDKYSIFVPTVSDEMKPTATVFMIIRKKQIPALMWILGCVKNKLIISDTDFENRVCMIENQVHYQRVDGHWSKFINNANRNTSIVNLFLCDKTRSDMLRYRVCDTDDVLLIKHRLRDWPCDCRILVS
jgi:hypothetical protein